MGDRQDEIEKTENKEQRQSRERAQQVEDSRRRAPAEGKDLEPCSSQRSVQPSDRTRKSD